VREPPAESRSLQREIAQTKPFHSRSQEAYLALLRTADEARRLLSDYLEGQGITLQQYNVLRILRGAGSQGLPTLAVAKRMIERTPGVTRLVDRMERKGWVARERCRDDRRRVWCRITPAGLEILSRLDAPVADLDDTLAVVLADAELEALIGLLARLRAHLHGNPEVLRAP
jgi:DNA-binding MarR family transcriptional regulator